MAYSTFRFQIRTVQSPLPLASVCPATLNATDATCQGLAERAESTGSATSRKRPVTELASALNELDLVGAVIAASHQAADD
jgi:hypothetical protein